MASAGGLPCPETRSLEAADGIADATPNGTCRATSEVAGQPMAAGSETLKDAADLFTDERFTEPDEMLCAFLTLIQVLGSATVCRWF